MYVLDEFVELKFKTLKYNIYREPTLRPPPHFFPDLVLAFLPNLVSNLVGHFFIHNIIIQAMKKTDPL